MRNRRFRHAQHIRQIADAHFMHIQRRQDSNTRAVAENLKDIGEIVVVLLGKQPAADQLDNILINHGAVANLVHNFRSLSNLHDAPFASFLSIERLNN